MTPEQHEAERLARLAEIAARVESDGEHEQAKINRQAPRVTTDTRRPPCLCDRRDNSQSHGQRVRRLSDGHVFESVLAAAQAMRKATSTIRHCLKRGRPVYHRGRVGSFDFVECVACLIERGEMEPEPRPTLGRRHRPVIRDGARWYPSIRQAADDIGVCSSAVHMALVRGRPSRGQRFEYADKKEAALAS